MNKKKILFSVFITFLLLSIFIPKPVKAGKICCFWIADSTPDAIKPYWSNGSFEPSLSIIYHGINTLTGFSWFTRDTLYTINDNNGNISLIDLDGNELATIGTNPSENFQEGVTGNAGNLAMVGTSLDKLQIYEYDGTHIITGSPRYWHFATLRTVNLFGRVARKNIQKVLKVRVT